MGSKRAHGGFAIGPNRELYSGLAGAGLARVSPDLKTKTLVCDAEMNRGAAACRGFSPTSRPIGITQFGSAAFARVYLGGPDLRACRGVVCPTDAFLRRRTG